MYVNKVGIEYRIEMTLYDSFRLLTPVGIQDSHFGRYYTGNFITSLKQTKKVFSVYPRGKYKLVPNSRNIAMSRTY